MDQVVTTAPMIRCIIWREEKARPSSILFKRTQVILSDEKGTFTASHWELPNCKKLQRETAAEAAERIAYDSAGILADDSQLLRQFPLDFSNVQFNPNHYYVFLTGLSGRFDQDDNEQNKEGTWQWISIDLLSCYAIRKETMAMIAIAIKKLHLGT